MAPGGVRLPVARACVYERAARVKHPPRVLRGASVRAHAALAAWNRLQSTQANLALLEVWREMPSHQPASVYRLALENDGPMSVFAKHADAASCRVERMCYEEVVPRLALSSPTYFGAVDDPDGSCWLFLEDVGREKFSALDPTHRGLASRWLGRLHRFGAELEVARRLPEAGPPRYLQHLKDGRARIRAHLENPAMSEKDRALLNDTLAALDRVESRWDALVYACTELPETIVHGDFCAKNVRIREESCGPVLYAIDWELAGWGIPVVDLAPARGENATIQVDPALYATTLRGRGRALDRQAIERLSLVGYLFRRLAAIDWESLSLHFEDPLYLLDPITSIEIIHRGLTRGLHEAEAWLR